MNTPITIRKLISEENCYETLRQLRWPEGVRCPFCGSVEVNRRGYDDVHRSCRRDQCKGGGRRFDDLSETVLAGHHQPLSGWIVCLYFMGLNLSNRQIAQELDLHDDDVQVMTTVLRAGVDKKSPELLQGEVECDEVYLVAGHKGPPEAVQGQGRWGRRRRLKGARGRGTLAKDKPPVVGMIARGGAVVIRMLANVQQATIAPLIRSTIARGTTVYTDEYDLYSRLPDWGYTRKSVNHSHGEYARDEDGDGFCEVHVNTIEGFWSLLRSWLRPHRGISQEKLPLYLSFFEFVHNARVRGKHLLPALLGVLVA